MEENRGRKRGRFRAGCGFRPFFLLLDYQTGNTGWRAVSGALRFVSLLLPNDVCVTGYPTVSRFNQSRNVTEVSHTACI